MGMLIARLRSDNPRCAARLCCDEQCERVVLEGVGPLTPAKLIDLENRQQLVWEVDQVTRDRVLRVATAQIQQDKANQIVARGRAAAAEAAATTSEAGGKRSSIPAPRTTLDTVAEPVPRRAKAVWAEAPPHRHRWWAWAIAAAACGAAAVVGLLFPHQIADRLSLSSARQVSAYTELYFSNPEALPTRLTARGPNTFSFTVFNHEGRKRVYQYVVTLAGPTGLSVVQRGSVGLAEDSGLATVVAVAPIDRHRAYVVTVTIAGSRQSISFTGSS
jgi:hypothetical protein